MPDNQITDDKALEILRVMRPDVPETAFRYFLAGTNGPYLHVEPDEFRRIAAWIMTGEVPCDEHPF
jgi:hypothetical protein